MFMTDATQLFILHIRACNDALHLSAPAALISVMSRLFHLPERFKTDLSVDILFVQYSSAVFALCSMLFSAPIKGAGNDLA